MKGSVFIAIKDFILKNHRAEGYARYLQSFSPEDQILLDKKLIGVSRIPARVFAQSGELCTRLFGSGNTEYFQIVMAYVADQNINSFMKVFLRMGSPSFVMKNVPVIWKHYFYSEGTISVPSVTEKSGTVIVKGGNAYGEALCHGIIGWGTFAINFSGGKNLRVTHPECVHHGAQQDRFEFSWDL